MDGQRTRSAGTSAVEVGQLLGSPVVGAPSRSERLLLGDGAVGVGIVFRHRVEKHLFLALPGIHRGPDGPLLGRYFRARLIKSRYVRGVTRAAAPGAPPRLTQRLSGRPAAPSMRYCRPTGGRARSPSSIIRLLLAGSPPLHRLPISQ